MLINEWSDATAMAEAVRNKTVSPRELVEATIREAEMTNPKINAIVSQRYEKALVEAETKDFSDKPFAGVPIFLKDLGRLQVLAYLQTFDLRKRITMLRNWRTLAFLSWGVPIRLSLVSKILVMPKFMVLSIFLMM